jgi:hypothetical protein
MDEVRAEIERGVPLALIYKAYDDRFDIGYLQLTKNVTRLVKQGRPAFYLHEQNSIDRAMRGLNRPSSKTGSSSDGISLFRLNLDANHSDLTPDSIYMR